METIAQGVGIRNGVMVLPNSQADLVTIMGLLDRIKLADGGTANVPNQWSTDRTSLIIQVTAAILSFQTVNHRPIIDGAVDPNGGTLQRMNQLAAPGPVTARVIQQDVNTQLWVVANPGSLDGTGLLRSQSISPPLTRKLVRVNGTSITWFGVVVPTDQTGGIMGGPPHIFFTPSPYQGGYQDAGYNQFSQWQGLWDKYTSLVGSQLVASTKRQILVIPFYKNAQTGNLGSFLTNWEEVISAVVTASIDSIDPLFLRNTYQFNEIFTSSFSNGITSHQNFNTHGGAAATRVAFDLDGQASGSNWTPGRGVVYSNTHPPHGQNPTGTHWFVGGRFAELRRSYQDTTDHNLCPFLLLHGLARFG